jgi:hypothetical protein
VPVAARVGRRSPRFWTFRIEVQRRHWHRKTAITARQGHAVHGTTGGRARLPTAEQRHHLQDPLHHRDLTAADPESDDARLNPSPGHEPVTPVTLLRRVM